MKNTTLQIREGSIEECLLLTDLIPEFQPAIYNAEDFHARLDPAPHLILIAESDGTPAGFKAGYQRDDDGSFYSWMGGVLPGFRRMAVASALAEAQETWAKKHGYTAVVFKTRNYLKSMLIFALKNGFHIAGVIETGTIENHRIILRKKL